MGSKVSRAATSVEVVCPVWLALAHRPFSGRYATRATSPLKPGNQRGQLVRQLPGVLERQPCSVDVGRGAAAWPTSRLTSSPSATLTGVVPRLAR